MSYDQAKQINLSEKRWVFSWWYVDNVQTMDMAPYFSPYLRNARIDGSSIIIRPWHQLHATLTAWTTPKGIGSYQRANPSNDVMVVRHDQSWTEKIVTVTSWWTVTPITTTGLIASSNKMSFTNTGDVIYCMNGSDNYGKLSWTTYSTPTTGITNFAPSYGVTFNKSHFVSWWSTNSNIVYKSVANNYEDFASTWSDQFKFDEQVTWLSTNSEALFYFTKNTISVTGINDITESSTWVFYTNRQLQVKEWAVNHYSIVEAGNNIYYLTPSNSINKLARGNNIYWFETQDLTERSNAGITKILSTLDSDQSWSFWYFLPWPNLIKWYLKSNGSTFNDVCIVLDVIKDVFLIDWQQYYYDWIAFKWSTYTISALEAKIYRDEYSQDDEWTPIPFEYWTNEFYLTENKSQKKILRESWTQLDVNELAILTQDIYIDGQSVDSKTIYWTDIVSSSWWIATWSIWEYAIWEEWEESLIDSDYYETYIPRTKWCLNKKWKKIQRRFTNSSLAGKVRLKNLIPTIEVLPLIATSI